MKTDRLPPGDITIQGNRRALNEDAVYRMVESISTVGLRTPVSIRWASNEDGEYDAILVTGRHRLAAVQKLGWDFVDCYVIEGDERDARLWEIAENLHRADLTELERGEHYCEWMKLSHEKPGQIVQVSGGRGNRGGVADAARHLPVDGSNDEAKRANIRRAAKVASLDEEAKAEARQTGLDDNQSVLLAAAREPDAASQVRHLKAEAARREAERQKKEAQKANKETDRVIALTEAQQFAEWLLARTDLNELPVIISWLEGTKPREVIAALRREAA